MAIAIGLLSVPAAADHSILVIASKQSPLISLTREEVADIFLGRSTSMVRWRPIDSSDEGLRDQFYEALAGISANRARARWARLVFSARLTPPREMPAEPAIAAVTREDMGITYVFREQAPRDARVLLVLP